tara:strand:+ start:822 stop:1442 length:621 start_codon:yes stop_codon:yes gene_type:complete
MKNVTILDYGMGNIKSLYNAIKFLGYKPLFYSEKKKIHSEISILPGVGAFNHAMKLISKKKIKKDINDFINNKNNKLIGICLGMQLLFNESSENNRTKGLDIISGKISKLSSKKSNILPNVGWSETIIDKNNKYKYLYQFNRKKFYYVHSYHANPRYKKNQLASAYFNEKKICAIAVKNNVIGTQFHPEKSSKIGLDFLDCIINNH